jgi:RNA polymerase sigma factor (sigma-70 family)
VDLCGGARFGDGVAEIGEEIGYGASWSREATVMEVAEEGDLVARALAGHRPDVEALVRYLKPVLHVRCARALLAVGAGAHRNLEEEVADLVQDVYATLFADGAKVLRAWSAERGLDLRGFVAMVARRRVAALLATRKRNPWTEEPMEAAAVERALPDVPDAERRLVSAEAVSRVVDRVAATQSERGREMLRWLVLDGLSHDELRERSGMSDAALYQWRSRILKAVRGAVEALAAEDGDPRAGPPLGAPRPSPSGSLGGAP